MLHTRKQIKENQKQFITEIVDWLKSDFKNLKKELLSIERTEDIYINKKKADLLKKHHTVEVKGIVKEIHKLIISDKNIEPNLYAWWDDENKEVIKYKYDKAEQTELVARLKTPIELLKKQ